METTGCGTAIVTPFRADGAIDEQALWALVNWQIESGIDFIVACGSTGEAATLEEDEWLNVIRIVIEAAAGRVPVWAGCTHNSTRTLLRLAAQLRQVKGVSAVLSANPYYNKPTQEGQYQHFKAIAEATGDLPVVLYNVPGRSVADLQHDTVLRLAQVPGIVGIKEATGNIERAQWLIKEAPKGFAIYSGDDPTAVALMLCGGHGNVSVTANVAPRLMHELCVAAIAGNVQRAMEIQLKLLPLHKALFVESNPIPVKWAVARMGLCGQALRLPLTVLTPANQPALERVLQATGLL